MAQYRSQWTGEVIDDAVGKAKNIEYVTAGVDAQAAFEKVDAAYGIAPVYAVYTTFENFSEISCRCVERETPAGQIVYRFEGIDSQQKQWRWTLTKSEYSVADEGGYHSEIRYAWNGPFTTQLAGHESTSKVVALYENSQTATQNIAKGQYVIWFSRLYTADSDITVGTTLRSAGANKNLTAVSDGGLNDLKSAITKVETDLASIHATGTTNTTGATIASGTYFYLNGALVQAKADIAVNATFTSGTNYEAVTAGALNQSFSTNISGYFSNLNANVSQFYAQQNGKTVSISLLLSSGTPNGARLFDIDSVKRPAYIDTIAPIYSSSGALIASGSVWIERDNRGTATYYGSGALSSPAYAYMTYTIR